MTVRLSKSGLGFRVSNADAESDGAAPRAETPWAPLGTEDQKRLFARLPALKAEPDDAKNFSMRDKSIPAPKTGKTVAEAFPPPASAEPPSVASGPLTVERRAPEGPVELAPSLSLTFSQPMVPVTGIGDLPKSPVRLVPEPPGKWRWLGTKTLLFQPDTRFPMATEYAVTVPAGTRAESGSALAKDVSWTFVTPPPKVKTFHPSGRSVVLDPVLVVSFDQAVDPKAMLGAIALTSKRGSVAVSLASDEEVEADEQARRVAQQAEKGRWLAFKPSAKLAPDTRYTITVKSGAKGAEGPRPTVKDQSAGFDTFGAFKIVESRCGWAGRCPPMTPFEISFSNPIDAKTFDPKTVKASPEIPGMKVTAMGTTLSVSGRTKGRTKYQVTVGGGLTDIHGQTLDKDATVSFDVGSAEPNLFGAEREMVVLDPAAPKQYRAYAINEPSLRARVYVVKPEDWNKYGAFVQEWERPRKLSPPGRLVSDTIIKTNGQPDELTSTPIDLAAALPGGLGNALVIVESTRTPPPNHRRPEFQVWVQVTELGLEAFLESDRVTGWVSSLKDGSPIDDADIVLPRSGVSAKSKGGIATLELGGASETVVLARKGKDVAFAPTSYLGSEGILKRTASDAVRWFVFDDRGMYKPGEEVHIKGWVRRSGQGRGGDIDAIDDVARKVVTYKVRDPRYAEIGTGKATLDDQGAFDLSFKLPANANLGHARLEFDLEGVALTSTRFTHAFQVQEFRRPEFEVTARSTEGPHLVGGHAVATVNAAYYAGGGLGNAKTNWIITRSEGHYTPPNRGDFHFGPEPEIFWHYRPMIADRPDAKTKTETWSSFTNSEGVHRIRLDFDALEPSYPMSLDLSARVEDVNRQEWTAATKMLVHPASAYVGLKLAKSFVREGENIDVDLLASDIDGKLAPGRTILVKAARLDSEQKGEEFVEKEVDVQTCQTQSPGGGGETVRCSLKASASGRWRVTAIITDAQGRRNQTATTLYVMGKNVPRDRSIDGDKVSVIADKKEYDPGATAEVLVIAPFAPAEGVLTVRRQGIVHLERFTLREAAQTLKVKLDDAMVPNVEIAVELVGAQSREGKDGAPDPKLPKRPAYAVGATDVKVLPASRTLSVKALAAKPKLDPGGQTPIDVEVLAPGGKPAPNAEVALIVVDESVLALSGYTTPAPLDAFYGARSPDVTDIGNRRNLELADLDFTRLQGLGLSGVGEGGGGFGSGMARAEMAPAPAAPPPPPGTARMAAPKAQAMSADEASDKKSVSGATTPIAVRADFSALALFSPKVRTDAKGKATIPIKLPDNLTRYRVMAVASSDKRFFGHGESSITARLPVMARPSAPRFLNFGDRFELPVVVQNQTDAPMDVGVVVRGTNAKVEEPLGKRVTIAANDRAEVRFWASTERPGTARFQIGVAAGAFADASQIELPVYTPATTEAFATYGQIDEGVIAQPVQMPKGVFTEFGGLEVSTSSTQLQALTDAVLYLVKYPYECNEQIASRVVSIAALRDVLTAFKAEGMPSKETLEASMKADLAKLKRHQNGNGGWGFWQEEPWPYLSIHVSHALVRAKEKGYAPDETMMKSAQTYLRNVESFIPSWYGQDARRALVAYSLFVRKKMGDADVARAKRLVKEAGGVDKLPIEAVGWIWPTISDDKSSSADNEAIRRFVQNRVTETAGAAHFVSDYKDSNWVLLSSDRRADGVLLDAIIGDQPNATVIPKLVKGLLDHRTAGRWENTQENAFVLLALDRYFATYEKVTPDFVARVWLGDRFAGEHAFKGRTTEQSDVQVPMAWLAKETAGKKQDLTLAKTGAGRLYYRIGMQYAPTDLKLPPADHGFVVSRTYEGAEDPAAVRRDADGTWRVKNGAKVRVRVSMVANARRYHVALVDPIAAGFEVMNPALNTTGPLPKDPQAEASAKQNGGPYWYWMRTWYEHQNVRDERVEAFASLLWDGVWDYTYVAKATTPGVFVVPPPKAEEMYSPETFGRGAGDRVIIE